MNNEKFEQMIKKSQRKFLIEHKEQLTHISRNLIAFLNNRHENDFQSLYQFFHRVKGTAGTIQLMEISETAGELEELMTDREIHQTNFQNVMEKLVKGTGHLLHLVEMHLEQILMEGNEYAVTTEKEEDSALFNGKVLVLDDDVTLLNYLDQVLTSQGYEAIITDKPDEALEHIKVSSVDLAILDMVMPEKSGLDIYKEIMAVNSRLPIIFMTGLSSKEFRSEAFREGADYYLQKPIDSDELIARINGLIRKSKLNASRDNRDELTGVYTRKHFIEEFEKNRNLFLENAQPFAVAFMDLDDFKSINDTYGHLAGDDVLVKFSEVMRTHVEPDGSVFRFGGDEFLLLIPESEGDRAKQIIENLREDVNDLNMTDKQTGEAIRLSFSAGVAEYTSEEQTKTTLLEKADKALYAAKEQGKNLTVMQNEVKELEKNRILVVDDEQLLVSIIQTRLGYLGYDVDHAKDGQEALLKLEANEYDLILLDIMLPKVTGTEVLKRIKGKELNRTAKIMMISGRHSESSVLESLRLGAHDFFEKPFSLDVLEHKIKKLLTS